MDSDKNIDFVARHYRRDAFSASEAWKEMGIGVSTWRRRIRIAAVIAIVLAVSATATVFIHRQLTAQDSTTQTVHTEQPAVQAPESIVRTIDFDNATLPEVLDRIRQVYGLEVENIPADADSYRLTLHFEGNATDLLGMINEILGTELKIKQ